MISKKMDCSLPLYIDTSDPPPIQVGRPEKVVWSNKIPDAEMEKVAADEEIRRFCEQAFVSPESARSGAKALLEVFNDTDLWLANLVQPSYLVAELRQQCDILTQALITQWTREGDLTKLTHLANALMAADPPVLSHVAGQTMAALAGLLGIKCPAQAPTWLKASLPLLSDSTDQALLRESTLWVRVGQLLADALPEDQRLWNRRLREPNEAWDWTTPESLDALERLMPVLEKAGDLLPVFKAVIPVCWWEMWLMQRQSHDIKPASTKRSPREWLKFGSGIVFTILAIGWLGREPAELIIAEDKAEPPLSFYQVNREEVPVTEARSSASSVLTASPSTSSDPASRSVSPLPVPDVRESRTKAAEKIAAQMPEITRLHKLVKMATLRESVPLVQGQNTMAAAGTRQYRALLRWLMLDPPTDPAVQDAVSRASARVLSTQELYETLRLCLAPDSPNLAPARKCASLLLELGAENLNARQRSEITAMMDASAAR